MSRITAQCHATLDGVIDAPPAEAFLPYRSDEGIQATIDLARAADALLLGRETWQHLAQAWRSENGPIADRLNGMPKYVVTRSGRRLFDEPSELLALALTEARTFPGGAVRLTCAPARSA